METKKPSVMVDRLPHPVLSKWHEEGRRPTRAKLITLQQELNANAASIDSVYSKHGHIFLTLTPLQYQTLLGVGAPVFVRPLRPTMQPVHPAGATAAQITEGVRQWKADWQAYDLMRAVEATLRKQLLDAGDDVFVSALKDDLVEYANNTVRHLVDHLLVTYGSFTETEQQEAMDKMNKPWTGKPIETTIEQIDDAQRIFAAGGSPISDSQKKDKLYKLVFNSGLLPEACQLWRLCLPEVKTWAACKAHFIAYAADQEEMLTAGKAGYKANVAEEELSEQTQQMLLLQDHVANMGVEQDSANITIQELTRKLADAEAALVVYCKDTEPRRNQRNKKPNTRRFYCWTHGKTNHSSDRCRSKKEGHVDTATFNNRQGGSNVGCN